MSDFNGARPLSEEYPFLPYFAVDLPICLAVRLRLMHLCDSDADVNPPTDDLNLIPGELRTNDSAKTRLTSRMLRQCRQISCN